jgi:transporter family-2 protein
MGMKFLLAPLALFAGIAVAVQAAANSGLKAQAGLGQALMINTGIVLLGTVALWLGLGARATFFPAGTPWTLYVGGVCGFVIIATLALAFPGLGAAWGIALMVLGQCVAALIIDHYGLLGMPTDAVTAKRLLGVALVVAGVIVLRA